MNSLKDKKTATIQFDTHYVSVWPRCFLSLELRFGFFVMRCDRFHEAKTRVFDLLDILLLLITCILICFLQAVYKILEILLELFHSLCLFFDRGLQIRGRHLGELLDLSLLLGVTQIEVGRAACRAEVGFGKLLEGIEIP